MSNEIIRVLKFMFLKIEYFVVIIFAIGGTIAVLNKVIKTPSYLLICFYILYLILAFYLYKVLKKRLNKGTIKFRLLYVLGVSVVIRIITIIFFSISQTGDYGVYLNVANNLVSGQEINLKYYGVFPHAIHYPMFIGIFYKIFGISTLIVTVINLAFSLLEAGLVFIAIEKILGKDKSVFWASVAVLNPASIFFVLFAGGEMLYSTIIMAAFVILIYMYKKQQGLKIALFIAL